MVVIVGLPPGLRSRIEAQFKGDLLIRSILLRRDGGFRLEPPPHVAAGLVERFADEAFDYGSVLAIALPYATVPESVELSLSVLAELGAKVLHPCPGQEGWPTRSPRLDSTFQEELRGALTQSIEASFPAPEAVDTEDIAFELLRGLASHSKMGPNNHSGEDDLWKARGNALGPGGRHRILRTLLAEGILGRKKNDSAGGKGWVYWIADIAKARQMYPKLEPYLR